MGATNHTTNYNLPQFVGTDKPTWLGDVNGAMNIIDAQMKANNTLGSTADTKADTALENSASAQTIANTALNDSATAQTTANSALQKALTNETNISKINLDTFTTFSKTDINVVNNSITLSNTDTSSLTLATNSDGSLCKIYGQVYGTSSASEMVNFYIQTDLRPESNINISPCAIIFLHDRSNMLNSKACSIAPLTIETDGKIRIRAGAVGGQYLRIVLLPMIYFVKNFGDLPE